jgi:hypothetical protein
MGSRYLTSSTVLTDEPYSIFYRFSKCFEVLNFGEASVKKGIRAVKIFILMPSSNHIIFHLDEFIGVVARKDIHKLFDDVFIFHFTQFSTFLSRNKSP